jgi:hypothetical protein
MEQNKQDRDQKRSPETPLNQPTGPTSTQGVEARDLPDGGPGGQGQLHHEHSRKLPQQTGENSTGDVGLRGTPDVADASDHGNRKRN